MSCPPAPETLAPEIHALLAAGQGPEAHRRYRKATGCSHAEATQALQIWQTALQQQHPHAFPKAATGLLARLTATLGAWAKTLRHRPPPSQPLP